MARTTRKIAVVLIVLVVGVGIGVAAEASVKSVDTTNTVDNDGDGAVQSFDLRINADTNCYGCNDESDDQANIDPYFKVFITGESGNEVELEPTDVVENEEDLVFTYTIDENELQQFESQTLDVRVELWDRDYWDHEFIDEETISVSFERPSEDEAQPETETPTETETETPTETETETPTETETETDSDAGNDGSDGQDGGTDGDSSDQFNEDEVQDSDGDGMVDSEDYAPQDPDVQGEADLQSEDGPGFGITAALLAVLIAGGVLWKRQ